MRSVKEVSKLTHFTVRSLHYYDEINLLKPSHVTEKGYRFYSEEDLRKLHQVKIFKEIGLSLKEIKTIMTDRDFDEKKVIETQKHLLILKRQRLDYLINQLDAHTSYDEINFEEDQWELVWDEIYHQQGKVQLDVLETVKDFVSQLKPASHVLDLGCGTGRNTMYLLSQGLKVTASDISEKGLDLTKKQALKFGYDLKTVCHDMRDMPYKDETFDAILCSWVCGHGYYEDMVKHAHEMLRVLKPGGLIFVDYPSRQDKLYGRGQEVEAHTFINNVPGEEKIPHHYSDQEEIRDVYSDTILEIRPHTYKFKANNLNHEIEAYLVYIRK